MPRVKRTPRNSITDRPRRAALLLRRQRGRLRLAAFAIVVVVALLGVSAALNAAAPASSLVGMQERLGKLAALAGFRIERVVVLGRDHTSAALLEAALGVHKGDPTFGFSLAAARARIESLPWVKSAVLERRLPGTIIVSITERSPLAIWQNDGRFSVIDRLGDTLVERDVRAFRGLPLVVGPGAPKYAATLLDALADLPALEQRLAAAVRVGRLRWNLVLKDGTTVELPGGHAPAALIRLAAIEARYALLERPLAVVDMRLADRLVLRPWPAHATAAGAPPERPPGPPVGGGR
ncbi:MAG: cell division protein FtsQ/DivIB [Acetobacteraceae bacterium]